MTALKMEAIDYINNMDDSKMQDVVRFLNAVAREKVEYDPFDNGTTPLDDFDYELSRRARKARADGDMEFVSFEEALADAGLTIEDLENFDDDLQGGDFQKSKEIYQQPHVQGQKTAI
ncbi:MAG: hypothetical protein FWB74_01085 [Defluviitaleaceae bacterium]|nr:hypothetical protein [Defluviitaleaceae bacterium]